MDPTEAQVLTTFVAAACTGIIIAVTQYFDNKRHKVLVASKEIVTETRAVVSGNYTLLAVELANLRVAAAEELGVLRAEMELRISTLTSELIASRLETLRATRCPVYTAPAEERTP